MTEPLVSHIWEAAAALASLIGLLVLLVVAVVENIRDRIAAKESTDRMIRRGIKTAKLLGMIK